MYLNWAFIYLTVMKNYKNINYNRSMYIIFFIFFIMIEVIPLRYQNIWNVCIVSKFQELNKIIVLLSLILKPICSCIFNLRLPVSPAGVVSFSNEILVLWARRVAPDRESEASCWVRVLIHNWGLFRGLPMPETKLVMGMRHNFEASILSCKIYFMTPWCKQT